MTVLKHPSITAFMIERNLLCIHKSFKVITVFMHADDDVTLGFVAASILF